MNRLWIPQNYSVVGLLEVGVTKDNFDEISKCVATQLEHPTIEPAVLYRRLIERHFL